MLKWLLRQYLVTAYKWFAIILIALIVMVCKNSINLIINIKEYTLTFLISFLSWALENHLPLLQVQQREPITKAHIKWFPPIVYPQTCNTKFRHSWCSHLYLDTLCCFAQIDIFPWNFCNDLRIHTLLSICYSTYSRIKDIAFCICTVHNFGENIHVLRITLTLFFKCSRW